MENATHALSMAFAVMVFVIALSVAMLSFNSVKQVADILVYSQDETNYYEYQGAKGKGAENRIVGLETIIPTLYKYHKENYTVVFKEADDYNVDTGIFTNAQFLPVYNTASNKDNWQESYTGLMERKYGIKEEDLNNKIFSFDLDEETLRHEPWTGNDDMIKDNLYHFLNGYKYYHPKNGIEYINYSELGAFISQYKDDKFVETIEEYKYKSSQEEDSTVSSLTKEKKKRMVIFTLIDNNS